ncbi:glycerophosphodiester phosphodiesterase family protein [Primorskyibacter sp. 2E107]|uniref:glycerophosphodiester phosphodiesterase family protein n=1 Tax=Primorskyibacter sp. 2E107 TaxID=3403458 RepID=UPI003AF64DF4
MPVFPQIFLERPIAHRGYHDVAAGRPENSRAAFEAAIAAGYGIELDLQLSKDGVPMVFHDYDLQRLTGARGPVQQKTAAELAAIPLLHGDECIPTLPDVLALVAGRAPLLIEIKDQDGAMGAGIGALEAATAQALAHYDGPVALMSFNPHSVIRMAGLMPDTPRGITTCTYRAEDWPTLPEATRDHLSGIPDFDRASADFISHDHTDLTTPVVAALKARGVPILCWTIRTPQEEAQARLIADNVTFEGYVA